MKYWEAAIGGAEYRGYVMTNNTIRKWVERANSQQKELYRSMYHFSEKLVGHLENRKSIKGYIYDYNIDMLVLDIDRGRRSDEEVYKRARIFGERLFQDFELHENNTLFYFSGTGYHFVIPDIFGFKSDNSLHATVKATIEKNFPEVDSMPFISSGLIRVPNTVNKKSGLYDVSLSFEEFESGWERIHELAKTPRLGIRNTMGKPDRMFPELIEIKGNGKNRISLSNPTTDVTCVQKMYNMGPVKGKRHDRILRMVSAYRRKNVPKEMVIDSMKAYMRKDGSVLDTKEEYAIEKHVNDVYEKAYTYSCNDRVMMEFCDPKCKYYQNKDYIAHVYSPNDLENSLHQLSVDIIDGRKKVNLRDILNLHVDHYVYPGMVCNIVGDTGMNKTAILQNIVLSLNKMSVLYISTEFDVTLLHRRFVQVGNNMTKDQVYQFYYSEKYKETDLTDRFKHIKYMRVSPNINELRKVITRVNPDVVAIDVINDIEVDGKVEGVSKDEKLAKIMKDTTDELKLITFTVQHISKHMSQFEDKNGVMKNKRMTVHSGKGGSGLEQKADIVLGINGNRKDNYREIELLKGRDDPWFQKGIRMNFDTFSMYPDKLDI